MRVFAMTVTLDTLQTFGHGTNANIVAGCSKMEAHSQILYRSNENEKERERESESESESERASVPCPFHILQDPRTPAIPDLT